MTNKELRIEIAKAKGWKLYVLDRFGEKGLHALYSPESGKIKSAAQIDIRELDIGKLVNLEYLPDWTHDIAAAWELVEEMYAIGFTVNIQRDYTGNTVYLTERGIGLYKAHIVEHADIAATAICESYLKLLVWKETRE